jgi:hypothetical protein
MLIELEKELKKRMDASLDENSPKKYRDKAKRDYEKLLKDVDKVYIKHSKLKSYEERIMKKHGIEIF